jgi:hypothetical protein
MIQKNTKGSHLLSTTLPEIYIDDCIRELSLMSRICPGNLYSRFSGMYDFYRGLITLLNSKAKQYSEKEFFEMLDAKVRKQLTKQGLIL